MRALWHFTPCENSVRFRHGAMDKYNPIRARNFAVALARHHLFLGEYDKYRSAKSEFSIHLVELLRMGERVADYHAKRGEVEKLMELVGEGVILEKCALRALLQNGRYSDFQYLSGKFGIGPDAAKSLGKMHLIDLYLGGKNEQARQAVLQGIAGEYDAIDAERIAQEELAHERKEKEKKEIIDFYLGPINEYINREKKKGGTL